MLYKCVTDLCYSNYVGIVKIEIQTARCRREINVSRGQIFTWILHHPVIPHSDGMAAKHDDGCYVTSENGNGAVLYYDRNGANILFMTAMVPSLTMIAMVPIFYL